MGSRTEVACRSLEPGQQGDGHHRRLKQRLPSPSPQAYLPHLLAFLHSHIQSLPPLRGPHTICNLFSPVSPSLCLLSDQFSINPKSFPASKQTSKLTPHPSSYYPIISPSRHRHTSPPPSQCTPGGLLPSKVH